MLHYPGTGSLKQDVAARFRMRYEASGKDVVLAGQVSPEPEGTHLSMLH